MSGLVHPVPAPKFPLQDSLQNLLAEVSSVAAGGSRIFFDFLHQVFSACVPQMTRHRWKMPTAHCQLVRTNKMVSPLLAGPV